GPPPVQGTHDQEAGSLAASGTRSRSRRAQVEVANAEDEYVNEGQYLADDAKWAEEEPRAHQPPHLAYGIWQFRYGMHNLMMK
ncbi:hypothetical protein A2U01_0080149, partial [Trifolium medium]|nr:hypothetical protein [Trifolium medium]